MRVSNQIFVLCVLVMQGLLASCITFDKEPHAATTPSNTESQITALDTQMDQQQLIQKRKGWVKGDAPAGQWGEVMAFGNQGQIIIANQGVILLDLLRKSGE